MSALAAKVFDFSQAQSESDLTIESVLNPVLERFQEQEALIEALTAKNVELLYAKNTSEKNNVQLSSTLKEFNSQIELLTHELESSRIVSEGFSQALEQLDPEIQSLKRQIENQRSANMQLANENVGLQKELKQAKKSGDPKKLIELNKSLREKNTTLTNALNKVKTELKQLEKAVNSTKNEEERLSYSSAKGECVILRSSKLHIKTPVGKGWYIAFEYWCPQGIGRLITWNGEQLNFADGGSEEINRVVAPSQEIVAWTKAWFMKNVKIEGSDQVIINANKIFDPVTVPKDILTTSEIACCGNTMVDEVVEAIKQGFTSAAKVGKCLGITTQEASKRLKAAEALGKVTCFRRSWKLKN